MRKSTFLIIFGICLILCQGLIPIAAYVTTFLLPREYTSAVTIEVKSDQRPIVENGSVNLHFVADQVEIIRNKAILDSAIDELGLMDKWSASLPEKVSKDEAYQKVLKMTNVEQKAGTDMLVIAVTSTDRQEAANLANTIAYIYRQKRIDDLNQQIINAVAELGAEVEKQRQKVKEAEDEVIKIRLRENINDPNPETLEDQPGTAADYLKAKQNYINQKKLLDSAEQKYETEKMQLKIMLVPVKIWDKAVPAKAPSSPNVAIYLALAAGLGFLCAILGVALLIIGLYVKRREASMPNSRT